MRCHHSGNPHALFVICNFLLCAIFYIQNMNGIFCLCFVRIHTMTERILFVLDFYSVQWIGLRNFVHPR